MWALRLLRRRVAESRGMGGPATATGDHLQQSLRVRAASLSPTTGDQLSLCCSACGVSEEVQLAPTSPGSATAVHVGCDMGCCRSGGMFTGCLTVIACHAGWRNRERLASRTGRAPSRPWGTWQALCTAWGAPATCSPSWPASLSRCGTCCTCCLHFVLIPEHVLRWTSSADLVMQRTGAPDHHRHTGHAQAAAWAAPLSFLRQLHAHVALPQRPAGTRTSLVAACQSVDVSSWSGSHAARFAPLLGICWGWLIVQPVAMPSLAAAAMGAAS